MGPGYSRHRWWAGLTFFRPAGREGSGGEEGGGGWAGRWGGGLLLVALPLGGGGGKRPAPDLLVPNWGASPRPAPSLCGGLILGRLRGLPGVGGGGGG